MFSVLYLQVFGFTALTLIIRVLKVLHPQTYTFCHISNISFRFTMFTSQINFLFLFTLNLILIWPHTKSFVHNMDSQFRRCCRRRIQMDLLQASQNQCWFTWSCAENRLTEASEEDVGSVSRSVTAAGLASWAKPLHLYTDPNESAHQRSLYRRD